MKSVSNIILTVIGIAIIYFASLFTLSSYEDISELIRQEYAEMFLARVIVAMIFGIIWSLISYGILKFLVLVTNMFNYMLVTNAIYLIASAMFTAIFMRDNK